MTAFADTLFELIVAHDSIAIAAILCLVVGIAAAWVQALGGPLRVGKHRHPGVVIRMPIVPPAPENESAQRARLNALMSRWS